MYLNVKYRSMYTLDILSKTLSFTLTASSQVTLRLGVDVFYTGSGTSFSIHLPLKNGQVQEGAYVLNINGTETILSYKFPAEIPDIVWDVNGLLSTLSVSDNKTYTGTIISQSIECMPPAPLVAKTGLNKISYTPNIYSGDWSIIRKVKLSYDAGNGLNVINTIENTYTEIVLNINAKNLYQAVTNYIKSFVENCSPQREIAKFTKVNAYLQQYENYIEFVDYENAYNSLVKAGELVGVDKTIQEIIPFTINENGGGCCDKGVVPAHTAYFGFSDVTSMTDSIAKTLSIEKYNIYAHRDWHMSQDGITSRFAYIVVPTSVAALIAMVKLKGGLLAVWESQLITIDGIPYTAIKSPNKFFYKDATFVTDALDDCDIALQWVNSNGSNVLSHIENGSLHLKQGDRTKLDNLSGVNTGDQDLSGLEPKKGVDDFYISNAEKTQGLLATGVPTLSTVKEVANKVEANKNYSSSLFLNNLVNPDVSSKDWNDYLAANLCTDFQYGVENKYIRVNPSKNQIGVKGLFASVVSPLGCTNLTVTIRAKKASGVPTDSFLVALSSANGQTTLGSMRVDLTSDMSDFVFAAPVVENTEYLITFVVHGFQSTTQASPIVEHVKVYPTTPTGIYASGVVKVPITSSCFIGSQRPSYDNTNRCFMPNSDSSVVFSTDAEIMILEMRSTIISVFPSYAIITVLCNGVYVTNATCLVNGNATSSTITLPPGHKRVELVLGSQSKPTTSILGTFIKSIYLPAISTFSMPCNSVYNVISFYGDSITVGANSTIPSLNGFAQIVKRKNGGNAILYAWGYRSLYDDRLVINALAKSLSFGTSDVWLAIGTNDYGLNKQTSAAFGVLYGQLLDAIHAYNPMAKIWCQTPISRASEVANTLGNTLPQYRTEIVNAVASRLQFCELVNGTEILTTTNLSDGIHPTDVGHSIYAGYVLKKLGI